MFSFLSKPSDEDEKKQAQALFEKIAALKSNTYESRNMRVRMGMLCRAHLDKTFVAGAEKTSEWQELALAAIANGEPTPELPIADEFQKIRSGKTEVFVFLPEEYVNEAFALGGKYQKTEISAQKAIDAMQALANQLCHYDLRLQEPFVVLGFLREELAAEGSEEPEPDGAEPPNPT